ncbi:hypothetical protein D3C76_982650 [compost metagenome]
MDEFVFFCVYCEELVLGNEKSTIFKTGFYQYEIPMGYCASCADDYHNAGDKFHIIDDL